MRTGKISVIIPAYNEEQLIQESYNLISGIIESENIDFEIIYVNDGSRDNTWINILTVGQTDERVKGLCFSRNFGKEAAMFAGLNKASGDCSVIIDCDLQHPPMKIIEMYRMWQEGYDVVEAVKKSRGKESIIHRLGAKCFYKVISYLTHMDLQNTSDFKLLDRKVVDILNRIPERNTFFRALSSWVGFKSIKIPFQVQERKQGSSKWSRGQLIKYAITNITSFSVFPMQIVTGMGILFFVFAIILGIQTFTNKMMGQALEGFTTAIIVELLVGSICMLSMGIIGHYIAKMYEEIKGRPRYIFSDQMNFSEEN